MIGYHRVLPDQGGSTIIGGAASFLPDGTFNGVEVVWIAATLALAFFAQWAARRAPAEPVRIDARDDFDRAMDDLFAEDAFAWPARRQDG